MQTLTPPGPQSALLGWDLLARLRSNPLAYLMDTAHQYGDITYAHVMGLHVYLLNNPDYIHEVFVTQASKFYKWKGSEKRLGESLLGNGLIRNDGESWKRQRRLVQPSLHAKRIEAYGQIMVENTLRMLESWQDGETRAIDVDMMKLTLSVLTKSLFDVDSSQEAEDIGEALDILQRLLPMQAQAFISLPDWVPTPMNRKLQAATQKLDEIVVRIINRRRSEPTEKGDLLAMLITAGDDDGTRMSDKQLRDEVMTLLIAGYETAASTLTWLWYLLSQHPDIEAKLHQEVDSVLANQLPTVQDLARMPYVDMIVREVLRCYPPAWLVGRQPIEDVLIGPYCIPTGSLILISPYLTHHTAAYFAEPDRFMPERFEENAPQPYPRHAYFPFTDGPRICAGNAFAMMEARLVLALISQRFRLSLVPGQKIELAPGVTLRSRYGMQMRVERRQASSASMGGPVLTA